MKSHLFVVLGVIISLILISGCARPADYRKMVPESAHLLNKHEASVRVSTEGGRGGSSVKGGSEIDDEGLKKAIEVSVERYGLFKEVVKINDSDYVLFVQLLAFDQSLGFNAYVKMSTYWTLLNDKEQRIWEKFILSTYTTSFGESIFPRETGKSK